MNNDLPKISIIVPIYNTEKYLPKCLDSLIQQTYKNVEIICVDDGSTDGSFQILEQYAYRSSLIKTYSQKNCGASAARNSGLNHVTGDWIMFVDSDDWIDLETCERMYITANSKNAEAVMCSYVKEYGYQSETVHILSKTEIEEYQKNVSHFHRRLYGPIGIETSNPRNLDIVITPAMQLFKRELVEGLVFPDISKTGTFEDGLFQIDVYARCKAFAYIDKPYYHYRKTNESSITTKYKTELAKKHDHLFTILKRKIEEKKYSDEYKEAVNNRIAFDTIGLAINEARAKDSVKNKAKKLQAILSSRNTREALRKLNTSYLPLHWKLYFTLLRNRMTFLLMLALSSVVDLHDKRQKGT